MQSHRNQGTKLSAFNVLAGPSRSSSSSISIVNGKISQSVAITYVYELQAKQVGKFTIDPVKITVDGKSYMSNAVAIEVVSGGNISQGNQQQTQQNNNTQNQQVADIPDDKVFLKIIVDKSSLYQGDYLTATVKFYSQLNVNDLGNLQLPKFNGVYSQELEIPQIALNRGILTGKFILQASSSNIIFSLSKREILSSILSVLKQWWPRNPALVSVRLLMISGELIRSRRISG